MRLSENTVEILKNFSSINSGLVVKPGKTLRTISTNKAVFAEAKIAEEFDKEFGVYDLSKLLGVLTFDKGGTPEVTFGETTMTLTGNIGSTELRYTDPKLIFAPPSNRTITESNFEVKFDLSEKILAWVLDMSSILGCPNVVIKGDKGATELSVSAVDVKGEVVDNATLNVAGSATVEFEAAIRIENLKIIPGDYVVEISSRPLARFTNVKRALMYWIAVEGSSSKFVKE
jgi:hypothetical protein